VEMYVMKDHEKEWLSAWNEKAWDVQDGIE
jgi:hypothetical protein